MHRNTKYTHEHTLESRSWPRAVWEETTTPPTNYEHKTLVCFGNYSGWETLLLRGSLYPKPPFQRPSFPTNEKKTLHDKKEENKLHQTHWAFSLALLPAFMNLNFMYRGSFFLSTCFEAFMGAGLFPASHLCFRSISQNKASPSKWTLMMSVAVALKHCLKVFWKLLHFFKYRNNYTYTLENNNNVALH